MAPMEMTNAIDRSAAMSDWSGYLRWRSIISAEAVNSIAKESSAVSHIYVGDCGECNILFVHNHMN